MANGLPFQCNVPTCDRLGNDSKVLDIHITNRDYVLMDVSKVFDRNKERGILIDLPRTNSSLAGWDVSNCHLVSSNSSFEIFVIFPTTSSSARETVTSPTIQGVTRSNFQKVQLIDIRNQLDGCNQLEKNDGMVLVRHRDVNKYTQGCIQ